MRQRHRQSREPHFWESDVVRFYNTITGANCKTAEECGAYTDAHREEVEAAMNRYAGPKLPAAFYEVSRDRKPEAE
jgi:hypothetical protein